VLPAYIGVKCAYIGSFVCPACTQAELKPVKGVCLSIRVDLTIKDQK
jgi:hypothetical protein